MDERVLGEMPSEGSEGSRRFGIYSSYSSGPKMHSISRIRLMFVVAIAVVVAFAVLFPMVQYASKSTKDSLPYPELANISVSDESFSGTNSQNCSTKVLSFGLDCTDAPPVSVEPVNDDPENEVLSSDETNIHEDSDRVQYEEVTTEIEMDVAENVNIKNDRMGRSRWPAVSTPYPYYSLPKPTISADDRNGADFPEQTNIFAIPSDMSTDKFSYYPKPRVNFTPPPYAFTPLPNFTDSYAQLSPYRIPKNYTNFEDILKFLNNKEPKTSQPAEKSERILNSRTPMMKVSGTYVMPLDRRRPGEILVSSTDNNEEARPFFNGHAYVSDPFLKFRPANPSDINRLIPIKSGVDIGPRFRKPISFVPSSSVPVDLYAPIPTDNDYSTAGSHTVAIFHPPPSLNNLRPSPPPNRDKPLSVTLDIYPVTVDSEHPEVGSVSSSTPARVRGRLDPKWRPKTTERPRWRPQLKVPRRPSSLGGAKSADNHMIVHLNLFPNQRKQYSFPRRGRQESTPQTDQKSTFLPGGQFTARADSDPSEEEPSTTVEVRGTTDSLSSTSTSSNNQPEYSALSGFGVEEIYTTTQEINHNKGETSEQKLLRIDHGSNGTTGNGQDLQEKDVAHHSEDEKEKAIPEEKEYPVNGRKIIGDVENEPLEEESTESMASITSGSGFGSKEILEEHNA